MASGSSTAAGTSTAGSTTGTVTTSVSGDQTATALPSGGAAVSGGGSSAGDSTGGGAKKSGGSTDVRVPATFAIRSGRRLDPQTVSAPAFLAVRVTVSSADGKAHHVVVHTSVPQTLSVSAGGRASVLISGQRAGQYAIDVDGSRRGALLIGGEPGP
jgi:hypothetical protein